MTLLNSSKMTLLISGRKTSLISFEEDIPRALDGALNGMVEGARDLFNAIEGKEVF